MRRGPATRRIAQKRRSPPLPSGVDRHGLDLIPIDGMDDPRLADYSNLKDRALRADRAAFIAEGEEVVRRLIGSRFRVRSVLIARDWVEPLAEALGTLVSGTPVYVTSKELLQRVVGFPMHRGVLAAGERGEPLEAAGLLDSCDSLVVLENLANHDNVGGIFRTVAALGGRRPGVLLSPGCCDPLYRKAVRVSMGWALRVPFATLERWPDDLELVRRAGFSVVAMSPDDSAIDVESLASRGIRRPAILLGTEGPGLTDAARGRADFTCRIAMNAGVDSLNVVVAGAIALSRLVSRDPTEPR